MSKVTYIEVEVGVLPEWYDEGQHDMSLEQAIEDNWHRNLAYADAQVRVTYGYQADNATVKAFDDDGNMVFSRDDHDLAYAFEYAKNNA